jgi:ArsR family transcriptional regulator
MNKALTVFKALGDETRLKILRALSERDMYTELLAERLQLTAATVSFHMKKLQAAGLVDARKEQYYTVYSLHREVLSLTIKELVAPESESSNTAEALREEMYRRKVIKTFMPFGTCKTMPAQVKKRMIIYEEIMKQFETGRAYTEKEVNAIISNIHDDYCTVRRAFVGLGWMSRSNGIYTAHGIIGDNIQK